MRSSSTLDDLIAKLDKDPEYRKEYLRQQPYYKFLMKAIKQRRSELTSKTVVITGITGTLGTVCADTFNQRGWNVQGFSMDGSDEYEAVNVTDAPAMQRWFADARHVDALITCAGVSWVESSLALGAGNFRRVIDINLAGTFIAVREAIKRGAKRIVTIGSIHGCTPTSYPQRAAYTASKAGVMGLTQALAVEFAPRGIAVNCVAPGHMPALMDGTGAGQALLDAAKANTPAGRLTTPEEVAEVVRWLCEDAPVAMTGQILVIDGGFTQDTFPMR